VRPVSLLLSFMLILGVVIFVLTMVIPQIGVTIASLADAVMRFVPKVQATVTWLQAQLTDYPQYQQLLAKVMPDWNQVFGNVVSFLKNFSVSAVAGSIGAASSIFSGVFDVCPKSSV
jgi:predicted PurR-regulated permease PerM